MTTASKARILVVEDDPAEVERIMSALTQGDAAHYEISTAGNLTGTLDILDEIPYDVVLLDLSLPDCVGFRTLETFREKYPKVPVLVMTGLGDKNLADRAVRQGAQGYICKKNDIERHFLRRMVRHAISRKKHENELMVTYRFLEIANAHHRRDTLLDEVTREIRNFTECDAVRIRLTDGRGKLETVSSIGFGEETDFCECCPGPEGADCVCLRVAEQRLAADASYYSKNGSFYVESSDILDTFSRSEKDLIRHACANRQYESVAIIPIRHGKSAVGVVHIADSREYFVTSETVALLEHLARLLGDALQRVATEQALDEREAEVFAIFNNAPIMMAAVDEELVTRSANRKIVEFSPWDEASIQGVPLCYGLGCVDALKSDADDFPTACGGCPLKEVVGKTLTGQRVTEREEWQLTRRTGGGAATTERLLISAAPVTVASRTLVMLYLEDAS